MTTALLVLAQAGQNTQETDPGVDPFLIVGTILGIIAAFAILWTIFTRASRRTRGGVEPPPRSQKAGNPPFEGIARDAPEGDPAAGRSRSLPPTGDRERQRDPAA